MHAAVLLLLYLAQAAVARYTPTNMYSKLVSSTAKYVLIPPQHSCIMVEHKPGSTDCASGSSLVVAGSI